LESKETEVKTLKAKLSEAIKIAATSKRKALLAEDRTARTKVLNELLAPLNRDKRSVMVELLESVKTPHLRNAFNKYLPTVLNESGRKVNPQTARKTLTEAPAAGSKHAVTTVTGDQRTNRLLETAHEEMSSETVHILRLAGIHK
jgi:hypothetical protein